VISRSNYLVIRVNWGWVGERNWYPHNLCPPFDEGGEPGGRYWTFTI
jgi:hypothetical protein